MPPRNRVTKPCAYCGKDIEGIPSHISKRKYCSIECTGKALAVSHAKQMKVCEVCGKEYTNYNPASRFCSIKCASSRFKPSVELTCPICNQQFRPIASVASSRHPTFCSQKCKKEGLHLYNPPMPAIEKQCPTCGKWFKQWASRPVTHCSVACRSIGRGEHTCKNCGIVFPHKNSGVNKYCSKACYVNYVTRDSYSNCLQCGKELRANPSQRARGSGKYCSNACKAEARRGKPLPRRIQNAE